MSVEVRFTAEGLHLVIVTAKKRAYCGDQARTLQEARVSHRAAPEGDMKAVESKR